MDPGDERDGSRSPGELDRHGGPDETDSLPPPMPIPGDQQIPGMAVDIKGTRWPGLTPPASEIAQLYELDPALAKTTLELHAEHVRHAHGLDLREQDHAHAENRARREADERATKRGSWMAFALAIGILGILGLAVYLGQAWISGALGTIGVAALVLSFLFGRRRQQSS